MNAFRVFCCLAVLTLTSCIGQVVPETTVTPEAIVTATSSPVPTLESTATPEGPLRLTLWVPPEFDPASGTPAGDILQERLDEFTARRSNTRIEVRVKSLDGPGGLLDSLTTANAAAPLALPDLVALPRPLLETAAIKGLLHAYDDTTDVMDSQDWYEYAKQMSRLQDSIFGLPFAGDPLIMAYRATTIEEPPRNFTSTLSTPGTFAFAAADPNAIFTLALYQADGGLILNEQEHPYIEADILAEVYDFYFQAATTDLMPVWITQLQDEDEVWQAFLENRADMAITSASNYLNESLADSAAVPIPTNSGEPYTYVTGWVWALASTNPVKQELSVELAEFLVESSFLAEWTTATGYFPPRPNALTTWQTTSLRSLAHQVSLSAQVIPPADILTSLGTPVMENTIQVLKLQTDPVTAAQSAATAVNGP